MAKYSNTVTLGFDQTGVTFDIMAHQCDVGGKAMMSVQNPDGSWFDLAINDTFSVVGRVQISHNDILTVTDWMFYNWDQLLDFWNCAIDDDTFLGMIEKI